MNTKILGTPPSGNDDDKSSLEQSPPFDLSTRLFKAEWDFSDLKQHYSDESRERLPIGTLGLFLAIQQIELVVDLYRFNYLGRAYPHHKTFDGIDFSAFDAFRYGISRQHAVFCQEKKQLLIIDNKSTNGTYLNRALIEPYQPYVVEHDDLIRLGAFSFVIKMD